LALSVSARGQELKFDTQNSALVCLTQTEQNASPIQYPEEPLERNQGALVRLRITFTAPDRRPAVEVVANSGDEAFADVALKRAWGYRLPCLKANEAPVVALQLFSFEPKAQRRVATGALEMDFERLQGCAMLDGEPPPWRRKPSYPGRALERGTEGVVLARMKFVSPTEPPEVEILFHPSSQVLADQVKAYLQGVRLTCLHPGEKSVIHMPFEFRLEGSEMAVLKDLTLKEFVQAIEPSALHAPAGRVKFDLSGMGCPFDVQFELWQPYTENAVVEIGSRDSRRQPLLAWLRTVPLALKPSQLKFVLAQRTTITIPCGSLDLS